MSSQEDFTPTKNKKVKHTIQISHTWTLSKHVESYADIEEHAPAEKVANAAEQPAKLSPPWRRLLVGFLTILGVNLPRSSIFRETIKRPLGEIAEDTGEEIEG